MRDGQNRRQFGVRCSQANLYFVGPRGLDLGELLHQWHDFGAGQRILVS
jgi:hypothetical protein